MPRLCGGVVVKSLAVVWQLENASVGDSTPKLQCGFCSTSMVDELTVTLQGQLLFPGVRFFVVCLLSQTCVEKH
jgi:hypothetical protein